MTLNAAVNSFDESLDQIAALVAYYKTKPQIACRGNCTAKAIDRMMASLAVHCPCYTGSQIVQRKQGCRVLQDTRPLMMTKGNAPRSMPLEVEVSARCSCPYTHILHAITGCVIVTTCCTV